MKKRDHLQISTNSFKILSALAFLETSRQQNARKDRIEYFVPLFRQTIASFGTVSFTSQDVQEQLVARAGLTFPPTITQTILSRCCKDGLIKKSGDAYHIIRPEQIAYSDIQEPDAMIAGLDRLLDAVEDYARTHDLSLSRNLLMDQLVLYLESIFSDEVLSDASKLERTDSLQGNVWPIYIAEEVASDSDSIKVIENLVKGCAVYNAVFFPSFVRTPSFRDLIVFIDSPLLCMALGISSQEKERYVLDTIALLRKAGIICRVLEPTVEEVRGILCGIENNMGHPDPSENPESFSRSVRKRGMTTNDIFELRNSLEFIIENHLKLTITPTHPRDTRYVGSEKKLAGRLADENGNAESWGKRVSHDVNCTAEIQFIRKGRSSKNLKEAKAVMVTSSRRTIRNIKRWWVSDEGNSTDTIPPMLSLESLANYVWLNTPSQEINSIHDRLILIAFSTALSPSPEVWKDCVNRIRELVRDGDMSEERAAYVLNRSDIDTILCRTEHLQQTPPSRSDIDKVIEEAVKDIAQPYLDMQEKKHHEEITAIAHENQDKLDAARTENDAKTRTIDELEGKIKGMTSKEENRDTSLSHKCSIMGWFFAAIACVIMLATVLSFLWKLAQWPGNDGSLNNASLLSAILSLIASAPLFAAAKSLHKLASEKLYAWLRV